MTGIQKGYLISLFCYVGVGVLFLFKHSRKNPKAALGELWLGYSFAWPLLVGVHWWYKFMWWRLTRLADDDVRGFIRVLRLRKLCVFHDLENDCIDYLVVRFNGKIARYRLEYPDQLHIKTPVCLALARAILFKKEK